MAPCVPATPVEVLLVDRIIQATWRLRKGALAEARRPDSLDAAALGREASAERSLLDSLEALERRQGRRRQSYGPRPSAPPSSPGSAGDGACAPSASDFDRDWGDGGVELDHPGDPAAWRGRLIFDGNVSEDSPVVLGTWVTVNHIISLIVDGWSWAELLRTHPELTEDDLRACLAYHVQEEAGEPPMLG